MNGMNDRDAVKKQYATSDRLSARIALHSKYSTNKLGFGGWIASQYRFQPGMAVLELGCGTGEMWRGQDRLMGLCSRLVLSDFSEGMLKKARETLGSRSNIEYRVVDIQSIPFADQAFDAVIAHMMLYHVPDLDKGLREVRRVLKKGGDFYCATYGENGVMACICDMFRDYSIEDQTNTQFTLQNGEARLRTYFEDVRKAIYEDSLAVTDPEDLADYIYSLTGMSALQALPRGTVLSVLAAHMRGGVLRIPKEYGMFIAHRR